MHTQINEEVIRNVVAQVLAEVRRVPAAPVVSGQKSRGRYGVFTCVDEAVAAARDAFEQLSERSLDDRRRGSLTATCPPRAITAISAPVYGRGVSG